MKKQILFLLSVSIIILLLWIRPGFLIATGESGLPFYHISDIANTYSHTWTDGLLGMPASYSIGSYYTFAFLSIWELLHIPGYLIQGGFFFIIIILSQSFLFFISRKNLPKKNAWFAIIASLFYIFNLVSIVSVWNRLQYPFIFLYAFLPFAFYFFARGLEEKKLSYIFIINFGILLCSLAFSSIPTLEVLWILFTIYLIFFISIHVREKNTIRFSLLFFSLLVIVWGLFNCWWLLPFLNSFSAYTGQVAYTSGGDLTTFVGISDHLGNLAYVFRLIHKDFFVSISTIWHGIYANVFIQLITFLIPVLAFLPLTFKSKPKYIYFFLGFSLIILFLMKGSAGIFGGVFLFFFSHIRFLEAFRNPFEKFSLLLPFGYAPLIAYSLYRIYQFLGQRKGKLFASIATYSMIALMVVISFPIINRWVFSGTVSPANNLSIGYYVQVPPYYESANTWLNTDIEPFRVVALPIQGEGITYTWPHGYSGVDVSNGLFTKPFISFTPSSQYVDNITHQLQYSLLEKPKYFSQILSLLNAKYVMIRSDIDFKQRGMEDPGILNNAITTTSAIVKTKDFGSLEFYQNKQFTPLIYSATTHIDVPSTMFYADAMELANANNKEIFFNPDQNPSGTTLPTRAKTTIIEPSNEMILNATSFPSVSLSDAKKQLYIPHVLPTSPLYLLLSLKERLDTTVNSDESSLFFRDLELSNKRLGELIALLPGNNISAIEKAKDNYIASVTLLNSFKGSKVENDNIYYFRSYLIAEKLLIADAINQNAAAAKSDIGDIVSYLDIFFRKNNVAPYFSSNEDIHNAATNRIVYDFSNPSSKTFEVLAKTDALHSIPLNKVDKMQIDGENTVVTPVEKDNWISFGTTHLATGLHEFQFSLPDLPNLIGNESNASFTLSSGKTTPSVKKIPLQKIDPHGTYKVSFDMWIEKGNLAKVAMTDNTELTANAISKYKFINTDGYNNSFVSQSFTFDANPNAKMNVVVFQLAPYNNCKYINAQSIILVNKCSNDVSFYNQFSKSTEIQVRNLRVEKVLTNDFILRSDDGQTKPFPTPKIQFNKINSSQYTIKVFNAKNPFYLVFSESFNPLWQLTITDINKKVENHYVVNSYANAWYIDRKGTYTMSISFKPEQAFITGKIISGIAIIASLLYLLWRKWKGKNG
ncbi:MAG TPA: alpha-(1-_3)-arabinofuranosyltransferase family protein [Candidatus Saccharimonadales bacterium]|nr:alpha-(1->3)-arabinofuranosyltransferase family protein [Candidatus Saccharimonadales bacterium]